MIQIRLHKWRLVAATMLLVASQLFATNTTLNSDLAVPMKPAGKSSVTSHYQPVASSHHHSVATSYIDETSSSLSSGISRRQYNIHSYSGALGSSYNIVSYRPNSHSQTSPTQTISVGSFAKVSSGRWKLAGDNVEDNAGEQTALSIGKRFAYGDEEGEGEGEIDNEKPKGEVGETPLGDSTLPLLSMIILYCCILMIKKVKVSK